MKRIILLLAILCSGGLLISSLALAAEMDKDSNVGYHMKTEVPQLNMDQITEMQRLLNQQGYEIGMVNGVIGEETHAAIRQFQEANQLTVTGTPNVETLRALAPTTEQQEFFGLSPEYGNGNGN